MTNKEFLDGLVVKTVSEGIEKGLDEKTANMFGEIYREGWLSAFGYMADGGQSVGEVIQDITEFDDMYKEFMNNKFKD